MDAQNNNLPLNPSRDWRPTKTNIDETVFNFLKPLIDGEINFEDVAIQLDALKKIVEKIEKDAKPIISQHVHTKYNSNEKISVHGCTIYRTDVNRYDYSVCGDEYYNELKMQLSEITEKIKNREELLKTIKEGQSLFVVNENTGEFMELKAPLRISNESYRIKYPQ